MPKKRSNSASGSYDVGYRRPPKQYQFTPGRTGNPTGINQNRDRSMAADLKVSLESELRKPMKIQIGNRKLTITQAAAGIGELVRQFAKGDHRARRDLVVICEKLGVDLTDRKALRGALDDALSAEDELLLADFVKRHGGQYPVHADAVLGLPAKDQNLLSPPADDPKLLMARPENSTSPQMVQPKEKSHE